MFLFPSTLTGNSNKTITGYLLIFSSFGYKGIFLASYSLLHLRAHKLMRSYRGPGDMKLGGSIPVNSPELQMGVL